MEKSLTQRILAEELAKAGKQNGKYEHTKRQRPAQARQLSAKEDVETKLRKIVDFGNGLYSIAQAAEITNRSKHAIRELLKKRKLTRLSFPFLRGDFISGIELTDVVVGENLDRIFKKENQEQLL